MRLHGPSIPAVRRLDLWGACALVAAAMLAVSAWLPLWEMEMHAPQYPKGLSLTAYGTRMEGDLDEVNELNHYVGAAPIRPDDVLELRVFPYALAGLVAALVLGAVLVRRRAVRVALALAVWVMAIGFLADLQWWLYRVGHGLSPDAPMRPGNFTPKVLGTTQVLNFRNETMVAEGFWLIVGAAFLVSFGPPIIRFVVASWRNTGAVPPAQAAKAARRHAA